MRVLGLDLGTVRIGVAVSDPMGIIASPHSVIRRGDDHGADHAAIAAVVSELEVGRVVVGLPLSMDGSVGPAAEAALDEIDELGDRLAVPVEPYNERLTTVSAERSLREAMASTVQCMDCCSAGMTLARPISAVDITPQLTGLNGFHLTWLTI